MKKIISVVLILLLSTQSLYKLGVITYFQLNREFIAEVLCINKEKPITLCNGQCFLKQKLGLADQGPQTPAPVSAEKQTVDFPTFITSENTYAFQRPAELVPQSTPYLGSSSSLHITTPFHPPTAR